MNIKQLLFIAVVAGAAAACSYNIDSGETAQVLYVNGPETKVQLDSKMHSVWNDSDKVSVFYKSAVNECWVYDGESGASEGRLKFFGERKEAGGDILALYPFASSVSLSGSVITTEIPSAQAFADGSFGIDAAVMAAKAEGQTLQFHYVCAFVSFECPVEGEIIGAVLSADGGEAVCGSLNVDLSGNTPVPSFSGSGSTVTISPAEGQVIPNDGKLVFSIAPGTYKMGFRITFNMADGSQKVFRDTQTVTIPAGHIKPYKFKAI